MKKDDEYFCYDLYKGKMATIVEHYFKQMNAEKNRKTQEGNTMLYRLDKIVIRKTLKIIDSFIQEQGGSYEIIYKVDGKTETVFSFQSMKEVFKRWKFYERMKWEKTEPPYDHSTLRPIAIVNGKRLRVDYWLEEKEILDFFGKRSGDFCQRLLEVGEWTNDFLSRKRKINEKRCDKGGEDN